VIRGNSAAAGGGISNGGIIVINGGHITGNHATGQGGGLLNGGGDPGRAEISSAIFRDNTAQQGAAIYNEEGNADITGSTIVRNTASGSGGNAT
jgi:hypothetical protein